MARVQSNPMNVLSLVAGEDLSSSQYYAVQMDTDAREVKVAGTPAAEGTHVIGVLQNKPVEGDAAAVATAGTSLLYMAANCDIGEKIMSSSGKGTPADADQKSVIGIALSSNANGDGGLIEILLTPGGVAQANESN
jgi:hypothetical protein